MLGNETVSDQVYRVVQEPAPYEEWYFWTNCMMVAFLSVTTGIICVLAVLDFCGLKPDPVFCQSKCGRIVPWSLPKPEKKNEDVERGADVLGDGHQSSYVE